MPNDNSEPKVSATQPDLPPTATQPSATRVETISKWIAIAGGLATALVAVGNYVRSVSIADRELDWKQAEQARQLVDRLHEDEGWQAMLMLEWDEGYDLKLPGDVFVTVRRAYAVLRRSLGSTPEPPLTPLDRAVIARFDRFFFLVAQMQVAIRSQLVKQADVRFPISWYTRERLCPERALFDRYMKTNSAPETMAFFAALPEWACSAS